MIKLFFNNMLGLNFNQFSELKTKKEVRKFGKKKNHY